MSKPEPQLGQTCWRLFIWLRKKEGNSTPRLESALDFGSGQSPEVGAKSPQGLLQLPEGLCVTRTSLEGITCSSDGLSGMPCPGNDGAGLPVASPGGDSGEEVESIVAVALQCSLMVRLPEQCYLGLPPPTLSFGISALSPS